MNECDICKCPVVPLKNNKGEVVLCDWNQITVIGQLGEYTGFRPHTCPSDKRTEPTRTPRPT